MAGVIVRCASWQFEHYEAASSRLDCFDLSMKKPSSSLPVCPTMRSPSHITQAVHTTASLLRVHTEMTLLKICIITIVLKNAAIICRCLYVIKSYLCNM